MNHIHAYSYLLQTLLPSISYSIWSLGLSCEVSDISHLGFCGAMKNIVHRQKWQTKEEILEQIIKSPECIKGK